MEELGRYIMGVTAAALLCSLGVSLAGSRGPVAGVLRLLTGVIMACVIIEPLGELVTGNLETYFYDLGDGASSLAAEGTQTAADALSLRIKDRTEAYILDMAAELDADLEVEVILSREELPVPVAVILTGQVSPYARQVLSGRLEQELGLKGESQQWN